MTLAAIPSAHSGSAIGSKIEQLRTRAVGRLELGLHAEFTRYGLARDLATPIAHPKAKIPISVRALEDRDLAPLFDAGTSDPAERREVAWRRGFIAKGARRGYVAIDERNGTPCYVQWLFGAADNAFIKGLKGFPALEAHQALLENAYTPAAHRGLGIMSVAMALIAERATDIGAQQVLTFVGVENIASLKGCQRAGFNPLILHRSVRFAFGLTRQDRFETLPDTDPRRTAKF